MKMTLRNTEKLFKKMSKKLSNKEFERFVDEFWTTFSIINYASTNPRIIIKYRTRIQAA